MKNHFRNFHQIFTSWDPLAQKNGFYKSVCRIQNCRIFWEPKKKGDNKIRAYLVFLKLFFFEKTKNSILVSDLAHKSLLIILITFFRSKKNYKSFSMLKLENSQYQNSTFHLNHTRYEKNIMIQDCLIQKDLQIWITTFF